MSGLFLLILQKVVDMEVANMPNKDNKCVCCSCGESLALTNFYKSNSAFYKTGKLPICKECFSSEFGKFATEYQSNKKAMQRLCMAFDVYFDEDLFDKCDVNDETVVGNYFRKLNMSQYKDKTFENTIKDGFNFFGESKSSKRTTSFKGENFEDDETESADMIAPEDIEKWGAGLDPTDYNVLNTHYRLLSSSNPQCDGNAEIFIIDLCYTKMQQMKAVRESRVDDYKKLTESYIKSFTQAGLKTVKDTDAMEDFTIGVNAETIEKYTPSEYYKNKSLYKDHDNIGDYITRFLLRPLRNLMYGTKDRDEEFFVKDEEETDGFTDDE